MRMIFFFDKSCRKCGGETILRPFSIKSKLRISLDQQSKVLYSWFLLYAKLRSIEIYWKLSCRPLDFISYKAFLKNKKRSRTSFFDPFSAWFLKTNNFCIIFYYLTKFYCLVTFTSWDIGQYVCCSCLLTRLWRHKFQHQTYLSN